MVKTIFYIVLALSIVKSVLPKPTQISDVRKGIIKTILNK